ncbi:MAG: hypothetical protein IIX39_02885 [Clostridia bacterium]|nr:hypothetical protein [Clostridia bacterium]
MNNYSLKFNSNGKFKILVASDLYEKTDNKNKQSILKSIDTKVFLEASIKALSPDLVVFNGDCAFGDSDEQLFDSVETITSTIKKLNIPLAVVFGDDEKDNNIKNKLKSLYSKYENCLFNNDKITMSENGDYNVLIEDSNGNVKFNLWFFDSNGKTPDSDISAKYDWIHDEQIEWYENKALQIKNENSAVVPSFVFQHIPVVEEYNLMREAKALESSKTIKGDGFYKDKYFLPNDNISGNFRDPIGCSDFNNGQFESWKNIGDVKAAFFSNSHLNDFEGYVDDILLSQCCASGFFGCHDGDRCGIKLITINEKDLSFDTKNFYFSDFGIESKSVAKIDQRFTSKQKRNIALASATLGTALTGIIKLRKILKNKRK